MRRRRWRVVDARTTSDAHHQILALAGVGAANAGVALSVITPFDRVEVAGGATRIRIAALPCWRHACRRLLAEASRFASAGTLRTAAAARIDLHAYQLEPALAVVRGRGSRVLIADEVGLGKTIQAGLIVSELRARQAADRILILAPGALCTQWAAELRERFDIEATSVDTREGRRRAALLPAGTNPWLTLPVAISSIDYVKRSEVLPLACASHWDAVVVDEAHGVASGTDRRRAAAAICRQAAYVVLLTATPHNGDASAFRALCELGESGTNDPLLIFSRTRRDIAIGAGRRVHRLPVSPSHGERRMHRALAQLEQAVLADRAGQPEAPLLLSVLSKRAYSSAYSLAESASRRLAALVHVETPCAEQWLLPFDGDDVQADAAPDCSTPLLADERLEEDLLAAVHASATAAIEDQRKLAALRRLLARLAARGERAIVFTEYRDTLLHVRARLGEPAVMIHGGMSLDERHASVHDFVRGSAIVLLATDAASEGLNLHHACRVVINLELPWNPMRLEQRIGRVDRIGQARRVHVFHLIARDTGELAVWDRLEQRLSRASEEIDVGNPLGVAARSQDAPSPRESGAAARAGEESQAEHARLLQARTTPAPEALSPGDRGVVAAFAGSRRRLRRTLRNRSLAIARASLEDGAGQAVAMRASAVLFSSAPDAGVGGRYVRDILGALARLPDDAIDPGLSAWKADAARAHTDFWQRRLEREEAIASALGPRNSAVVQAGLFDRRAERAATIEAARADVRCEEASERIAAARRSLDVSLSRPRVALLLIGGTAS